MATSPNWNQVRAMIQAWLASQDRTPNSLANAAGINRSILSRFLDTNQAKQPGLKTGSVLEIYRVIYPDLDYESRRGFFKAAGLSPLIFEIAVSLEEDKLNGSEKQQ